MTDHPRAPSAGAKRSLFAYVLSSLVLLPSCGFRLPGAEANDRQSSGSASGSSIPLPCSTPAAGCVRSKPARAASYQVTPCWFATPSDFAIECGYVTVPQSAAIPKGPQLKLAVATVFSNNASAAADPIVYIDGGPGEPAIRKILEPTVLFESLLGDRDLVLIDQRGVGFSEPNLECPTVDEVGTWDATLLANATRSCHDQLLARGVDPSAFTIQNGAADIDAVRSSLGYSSWNLYGISYGTRMSLSVAQGHANGVRSMALDGIVPPEIDFVGDTVGAAQQSFGLVFEQCSQQPGCAAKFGNVAQKLRELVNRLDTTPAPIAGKTTPLTGKETLRSLRSLLYARRTLVQVPALIEQLHAGDLSWFNTPAVVAPRGTAAAWGVYFSLICSAELPFTSRQQVSDTLSRLDPLYAEVADLELFDLCPIWNVPPAPGLENMAIHSGIPSLLTSGAFDPITPPAFGSLLAQDLTQRFEFTLAGESHGASVTDCGSQLLNAFFADPRVRPSPLCLSASTAPLLNTASQASRPTGTVDFSTELDISQLPPPRPHFSAAL